MFPFLGFGLSILSKEFGYLVVFPGFSVVLGGSAGRENPWQLYVFSLMRLIKERKDRVLKFTRKPF